MKNLFLTFFFLFLIFTPLFGENQNVSAQLKSDYQSGFYPGVLRSAEKILRGDKNSLEAFRAAVYAGESLFRMGRVSDALSMLQKYQFPIDSQNQETVQLNSARFFWLGRAYFSQKNYISAQECFYSSASLKGDYYSLSLLYAARSFFASGNYEKSLPLYEYVISNGQNFSLEDYEDSVLELAQSYLTLADKKNAEKCVKLISQLEDAAFDEKTKENLLVFKGEALEILGDYESACKVYASAGESEKVAVLSVWLSVYRADEAFKKNIDISEGCRTALEILTEAEKNEKSLKIKNEALDEFISISIARYKGFLKNWKECESAAAKCMQSENPEIKKSAVYWTALSQYERGDAKSSVSVIEKYSRDEKITDKSILILYAKALAKSGRYHDADEIFYSLGEKNQLDNDGRLDYSRTLLISGYYKSTKEEAAKASGDEAAYLSALASFNQHDWKDAEKGFSKVLASKSLPAEYLAFAQFYLGYAQYQAGKYAESVASISSFVSENPVHQFTWSAYMTQARGAALVQKTEIALSSSENAVKTARNEGERNEALILSAGILSDSKRYDDALALLAPYVSKRTEFAYECKYRSAEILVQKGNLSDADKYFADLAATTDKKAILISEEAAYRRAEIAYSSGDYKKATELFESYSKKWPNGRFSFAAIYFSADCLAKTGKETKAILRYEQITDSKAETSYRYSAEKNLIDLYEKNEEYESAIAMANRMIEEYGSQAKNDGIDKKIRSLKEKMVWNANSEEDRIKTAERELAKLKNDAAQSPLAMKNALFLAAAYRNKSDNKKSAELYLDAAKYARQSGDDENAARAFYGAIEAFDAAGLYGDARATFTEMKKLYPESAYTKNGEKLFKN